MKKIRNSLFFMMMLSVLTACNSSTLKEAIKDDIPFNIVKVVHIEKIKNGAVVFYLTEQKWKNTKVQVLSVAYMKGNDKKGWTNAGHNHWEYSDDLNLTLHPASFYDYDKKGNLERKISVIFGEIKNDKIESIEVAGKDKKYEQAMIFKGEAGSRYYFKLGDYTTARGITSEGKKIKNVEKGLNDSAF